MATVSEKISHLKWALEARAKNQSSSLALLTLLYDYETKWKSKQYSRAAQDLVGVSFSLWRAAFLAEKTSKRAEVFEHGRRFLEQFIEENQIAFGHDKKMREWTFNYYTRNARASLIYLAGKWKDEVPAYTNATRTATERWDHCQSLFDAAVDNFRKRFEYEAANKVKAQATRKRRQERKRNRKIVRSMILAARKNAKP
jgi:hypothetical protein